MVFCLRALITTLLLLMAGCATTIQESKRLSDPQSTPKGLAFIWSAAKPPAFSALPAFGAAMIGTSASKSWENYDSEFSAFGTSLKQRLEEEPSLKAVSVVALPAKHTQQQLDSETKGARSDTAVVVMYPERVTSYCTPGCYAFKVRVNYLSPGSRKTVWTGLIDLPPKAKHSDPFDPLALDFYTALAKQLSTERLLPQ